MPGKKKQSEKDLMRGCNVCGVVASADHLPRFMGAQLSKLGLRTGINLCLHSFHLEWSRLDLDCLNMPELHSAFCQPEGELTQIEVRGLW